MSKPSKEDIQIIYDGECPICRAGVNSFCSGGFEGKITKIDKRVEKENAVAKQAEKEKFNINEGVIIRYNGKFYQGLDALHLSSKLKVGKGFLTRIGQIMFRNKTVGKFFYPFLRGFRNVLVTVKGVGQIKG